VKTGDDDESHGEPASHQHHPSLTHQARPADRRAGRGVRAGAAGLAGVPASQLPYPDFTWQAVEARTADARFVLDQLERIAGGGANPDAEGNDLPDGFQEGLDVRKVGKFGFSLGGYATANTLLEDERVLAGIDLDGSLQDDGDSPKFPEVHFAR
jgi:hypothetical protein